MKILKKHYEFFKRYDNDYAMLQAVTAQKLKPGWYYLKGFAAIKIKDTEVDNNGNIWNCKIWHIDGDINPRNITKPTWILEFMEPLDFKKLDKCPLCSGKGKKINVYYMEGGPDFAMDYGYTKCDFCEVFKKNKKKCSEKKKDIK